MGQMLTFDASGYDVEALKAMAALANMIKGRADMVEKGAKAALGDRLEKGGESVSVAGVPVGRIQRTKGGEGCWEVKDPAAYGAWLEKSGYDDFYESHPMPTKDALDPGFIAPLIEKLAGGEIPDGVTWRKPAAPSTRITLDADAVEHVFSRESLTDVGRLLGLEAAKPEPASADGGDVFEDMGL